MNKTQLVEAIALDANISKIEARKAVDALIRVTVQALREEERITLTGLGTFSVQHKAPARDAIPVRAQRSRFRRARASNSASRPRSNDRPNARRR